MSESPFSTKLPVLQIYWDSVSSGLMKECPRKYQLVMLDGWTSREQNIDTAFGIFMHEGREVYHIARSRGLSHDDSLLASCDHVLRATWDNLAQRPWQGDERKNRYTLLRTLVWYLDFWRDDPLTTILREDGRPMVEFSFRFPLNLSSRETGEDFVLCGHLDRVADYSGQWWINDLKTTKSSLDVESAKWFFYNFSPDNQISLYLYAGQIALERPVAGLMLDGAQVAQGFSRFSRAPITRTRSQLDEWLSGFEQMLRQAEDYATRNFWPQNDKSCFRCQFRAVCALPPVERPRFLEKNYVKREKKWNPLEVRGE